MRYLPLLVPLFVSLLAVPTASAQTTRYVDPSGTDGGDCTDPADPCRTVAYTLAQTTNGDTIQLAAGVYTEDGGLLFDKSVAVQGAGAGETVLQEATLPFEADARLVNIAEEAKVTMEGLTLRYSRGDHPSTMPLFGGGAVWNAGTLTLTDVRITDSYASQAGDGGGAILNRPGAELTMSDCMMVENRIEADESGGGGALRNEGTATLANCLIADNEAGWQGDGGGILNASGATLTLTNTIVRDNRAGYTGAVEGEGGGLYNLGTATVIGGEIRGNQAGLGTFSEEGGRGGGLFNDGDLTLDDVLVTENATLDLSVVAVPGIPPGAGGGLYNTAEGTATLHRSSFSRNRTGDGLGDESMCANGGDGAGLYNAGTLIAEHSLIEDNVTGDGAQCADNTRGGNGGGLYVAGPTTISNSTIRQNRTGGGGGLGPLSGDGAGIYVDESGTLDLVGSTVSENETADPPFVIGGYGAGVFVQGAVVMRNSTVSGNLSESNSNGGGTVVVVGLDASLELVASTITENRSATVGGLWVLAGAESVRIRGSIIANNVGSECTDHHPASLGVLSFGHNLIGEAGFCAEAFPPGLPNANVDYVGTDDAPLDPVLGPLADNGGPTLTHALLPGSPAIDHGTCIDLDGEPLLRDQRGYTRVPPCDIGAFERDALPTGAAPTAEVPGTHVLSPGYPNPFNPSATFTLTLAEAETVTLTLVDALGREVVRLHDGPLAGGTQHRFEVDGARLASGVYVVAVQGETFRDHLRLTLAR